MSATRNRTPLPLRARIRAHVADAALKMDQRGPMEALLATVRDEPLGLDALDTRKLALVGVKLLADDAGFAAEFHRLRCSVGY